MKNAVTDFGACGDDAADNAAAALQAAAYANCGGAVFWPRGIYRFSAMPVLSGRGMFCGEGAGSCAKVNGTSPRADTSYGTVLRHTAPGGDFITVTGEKFALRDLSFWPVNYKSTGSELVFGPGSNQCAAESLAFNYCCQPLRFQSANQCRAAHIDIFAPFGDEAIKLTGSSGGVGTLCQGILLDDVLVYTPWAGGIEPNGPGSVTAWAPDVPVAVGTIKSDFTNGWSWSYVAPGITGATQPVPNFAQFTTAAGPFIVPTTDGTAKACAVARAWLTGILIDNYTIMTKLRDVQFLTCYSGIALIDSAALVGGASAPYGTDAVGLTVDHTLNCCINANSGRDLFLVNPWLYGPAMGPTIAVGAGFSGAPVVLGGRV